MTSCPSALTFNRAIKCVSKNLNEEYNLVHNIIQYLFKILKELMQDGNNTQDILLNKFLKFKLKSRYKKNKNLKYCIK